MEFPLQYSCFNCNEVSKNLNWKSLETENHVYIYCLCNKCNRDDIDWKVRCELTKGEKDGEEKSKTK